MGELEQSPLPLTYPLIDDVVREDVRAWDWVQHVHYYCCVWCG